MEKPQREMILLIGLPGVGKSTYAAEFMSRQEHPEAWVVLSFDTYMEAKRRSVLELENKDLTTATIMEIYGKEISDTFNHDLRQAVHDGKNLIIDMVHATEQSRAKRINIAKFSPDFDYVAEAIMFNPPEEAEHLRRMKERTWDGRFYSNVFGEFINIEPLSDFEKEHMFAKISEYGPKAKHPLNHEYSEDQPSYLLDLLKGIKSPNDLQR